MKITWTETHEIEFDFELAIKDLQEEIEERFPDYDYSEADLNDMIYYVIDDQLWEDIPNNIYDSIRDKIKKNFGGIQVRIELPPFPTLGQEDSVWKK